MQRCLRGVDQEFSLISIPFSDATGTNGSGYQGTSFPQTCWGIGLTETNQCACPGLQQRLSSLLPRPVCLRDTEHPQL